MAASCSPFWREQGTLNKQAVVLNKTRGQKERVCKLPLLYASDTEEVDSLSFGSVSVVLGLKFTRMGDTLVSTRGSAESSLPDIIPPPAVISASIILQSHSDLEPVQEALEVLSRTDPSVRHSSRRTTLGSWSWRLAPGDRRGPFVKWVERSV